MITALRAMGLVGFDNQQRLLLTDLAREHLLRQAAFEVARYIGLAADSPGVMEMVERLRTNRPVGAATPSDDQHRTDDTGVAFIYHEGEKSAMEQEVSARHMFVDPIPAGVDCILLSNILHDWDVPECCTLVSRCADALPSGGKLLIHDVFLNDEMDGPLPIALYSAALFTLTEGRAYSATEYRIWLRDAGLVPSDIIPTLVHCGLLISTK